MSGHNDKNVDTGVGDPGKIVTNTLDNDLLQLLRNFVNGPELEEICEVVSKLGLTSIEIIRNITTRDETIFTQLVGQCISPHPKLKHTTELKIIDVLREVWESSDSLSASLKREREVQEPDLRAAERKRFFNFCKYQVSDLVLSDSKLGGELRQALKYDPSEGSSGEPSQLSLSQTSNKSPISSVRGETSGEHIELSQAKNGTKPNRNPI